jgi:hypothetical protein
LNYSQENVVEISVDFDELQDVIEKNAADAESSVGREAAQGHDVEAPLVGRSVDPATGYGGRETMNWKAIYSNSSSPAPTAISL